MGPKGKQSRPDGIRHSHASGKAALGGQRVRLSGRVGSADGGPTVSLEAHEHVADHGLIDEAIM
jgi:hypothetical protein